MRETETETELRGFSFSHLGPEGVPYFGDPDIKELLLTADELKGFSRVPPELLEGPFGVKTLVELMQRIRLPVFHEHFEGSLHFETLFSMFHDKLELPKSFWMGIQGIMTREDGEMDIAKFIKRLSTRLMRDTIMAWTMQEGSADGALELMFDRYLAQKDMEGAGYTEVLLSFFAWCREGDLRNPPRYPDLLLEERVLYDRWEVYKKEHGTRKLPSMRDCAKLLKKCVDKNPDRYRWAADMTPEEIKADREHVIVGAIHCIRRNVPGPDQDIMNKPSKKGRKKMYQKGKKRAEQYVRLRDEKLLLGVDIAGDERKPEHGLRHFTAFFRCCNAQEPPLPFTTHAGESAPQDHGDVESKKRVKLALENLRIAIESGARRVGHAVRLLDWEKNAINVFKLFLEKDILIELNARSNMLTNVDKPQRHKVLQVFRGRHPLFLNPLMRENGEALYQRFRQRVLPTTDDPSVNRTSIFGLAEELAFDCAHTDNLGYEKPEAMLEELRTFGLNAMLR